MTIALSQYISSPLGEARLLYLASVLAVTGVMPTTVNAAEWNIITHNDMNSNTNTSVAIIENESGYTLEIYKDSVDAVRARFTLVNGLLRFPDNFCPTFQIDSGMPSNRSINDGSI